MNQPLFKKHETPNFSDPIAQQTFVQGIQNRQELIQSELNVNTSQQKLLNQRINTAKELINDLPASDPRYSALLIQMQMDQVELDELKVRETILMSKPL